MSLQADLLSMQSTLDQVLDRLKESVESVRGTDRDDLMGDLYEIERHIRSANRRLTRTLAGSPSDWICLNWPKTAPGAPWGAGRATGAAGALCRRLPGGGNLVRSQ